MIVRLSFLIAAASIATYAIKQINFKSWRLFDTQNNNEREDDEEHLTCSSDHCMKEELEEKKDEVKLINSIINPTSSSTTFYEDKYDTSFNTKIERDIKFYENEMANNGNELERLRNLVQELEEGKVNLEMELLVYHYSKEKESSIVELQNQLKIKTTEIDMLKTNITSLQIERKELQEEVFVARNEHSKEKESIDMLKTNITSLQIERKELQEEVFVARNEHSKEKESIDMLKTNITSLQTERKELQEEVFVARNELEKARNKIKELQTQFQLEGHQTKTQLLLLKQQVSRIRAKEEEEFKTMKDLEVEVMELKRNNKSFNMERGS